MAVEKPKHRRWVVRFTFRDIEGNRRNYWKGGFETRQAALQHEREVKAGIEEAKRDAQVVARLGMTVSQFADVWMSKCLKTKTRKSGYKTREGRVKNLVVPYLGPDVRIRELTLEHGEAMRDRLQAHISTLTKKPLAPRTINHCVMLAKSMMVEAVKRRHIDPPSPLQHLELVPGAPPEWRWLAPDDLKKFIRVVEERYTHHLLEILLGCRAGPRASEVGGLFVEDVDLTGRPSIRIRRDLVRGIGQRCKSATSHRRLVVPSDLAEALRDRIELVQETKREPVTFMIDGKHHQGVLLSVNANGGPHKYLPETLERSITGACKKAELPRITHRDLRHTFASHLRLRGIALGTIRDLLGHSSIQMTMRYAHIADQQMNHAADVLEWTAHKSSSGLVSG